MKCFKVQNEDNPYPVAPLVGAWIEMINLYVRHLLTNVAPLVGAWIEILAECIDAHAMRVAPLVGAWIEII